MIIYNITVNINNDVKEDWLSWMKEIHIPEVMKTGCFIANNIYKVLVDEAEGSTFSIQFTCNTMNDYEVYKNKHAPNLQKIDGAKYADKLVAFSTLLESI